MTPPHHTTCPNCDHDGALDGQGPFTRTRWTRTLEGDGRVECWEKWYRMHCPECGQTFATLEQSVRKKYDKEGVVRDE